MKNKRNETALIVLAVGLFLFGGAIAVATGLIEYRITPVTMQDWNDAPPPKRLIISASGERWGSIGSTRVRIEEPRP